METGPMEVERSLNLAGNSSLYEQVNPREPEKIIPQFTNAKLLEEIRK